MRYFKTLQENVEVIYKKRIDKLNIDDNELILSKIVLLDTELSEFMNEIEDHKLYKFNKKNNRTHQLEELCDCIHAICSIANTLDIGLKTLDMYYSSAETDNVLSTYKKAKCHINNINISRALENKEYISYMIESVLKDILAIAKAKDFKVDDITIAFVAVYTKNMIRANGSY